MMYGEEKSDSLIRAAEAANNPRAGQWSEGAGPRGTRNSHTCAGHRAGESMSQRLSRVREAAEAAEERTVYSIVPPARQSEALEAAFLSLRESGRRWMASGGWTAGNMKNNITDLHPEATSRELQGRSPAGVTTFQKRMENNARSASPRWRTKIVQYALVKILNAVL